MREAEDESRPAGDPGAAPDPAASPGAEVAPPEPVALLPEPEVPLEQDVTLRVARALRGGVVRGGGGALVCAGLGMGLAATGWFPTRPADRYMLLHTLAIGSCFGVSALVEAVGWGPCPGSRIRRLLTALGVWVVAGGLAWATQVEIDYYHHVVVEGTDPAAFQAAFEVYLELVQDDLAPRVVVVAILGFPFAAVSLMDGCGIGRLEQSAAAFFGVVFPALPACFLNPMFEGVNPDAGFQFLLICGLAVLLPAVGKLDDWRAARKPARFPDHALAWLATLALLVSTAFVWVATRAMGNERYDYLILSQLRIENAGEALHAGDPERALEVCRQAEREGTAIFARQEARNLWLEAAWTLDEQGPPGGMSEEEHERVAGFLELRPLRFRRAEARARRGEYELALADLDAAHALEHYAGEPGGYAELWLLHAEVNARLGNAAEARADLERCRAAAAPPADAELNRVRALIPLKARALAPPGFGPDAGGW